MGRGRGTIARRGSAPIQLINANQSEWSERSQRLYPKGAGTKAIWRETESGWEGGESFNGGPVFALNEFFKVWKYVLVTKGHLVALTR
jgi:hypothetical protein